MSCYMVIIQHHIVHLSCHLEKTAPSPHTMFLTALVPFNKLFPPSALPPLRPLPPLLPPSLLSVKSN